MSWSCHESKSVYMNDEGNTMDVGERARERPSSAQDSGADSRVHRDAVIATTKLLQGTHDTLQLVSRTHLPSLCLNTHMD